MRHTLSVLLLAAMASAPVIAQNSPSKPCPSNPGLGNSSAKPSWNGWGAGLTNARFQDAAGAQLAPDQVTRLKLKWAFGFPGAKSVYGQPTVVAGRVFVGVDTGAVYSIDAGSGCSYWSFQAADGVRSAVSIGPGRTTGEYLAYFGDLKGNVYALNAATGEQVWKTQADTHPGARITGATQLYQNRLYVPVASDEEVRAVDAAYQCCTFRGSVLALDTLTGRQVWKTYVIPEAPKATAKNAKGTQQFGPSGGGVWNSPTLDPKRHALYVGTGDAYTAPAPKTTDAILALDMDSGKVLWSAQDLAGDAWVVSCIEGRGSSENCPKDAGPDFDFGSSPMLRTMPNGKNLLIAGQKSGIIWAHDPDRKGAVAWKTSVASKKPAPQGQVNFGGSADDKNAYFGLDSGGIVALSLTNGERLWFTDIQPEGGRHGGQDAAVSTIPGVLFSGGWDGVLRALSTSDGKILWTFDMLRDFDTVNGVPAKGGSMGSSGPTVAGGMVFAGAGYPGVQNGRNGNVLLAFAVE
ncbi:MAG TPA: PQQ-binding-like beta-propeller repeat protein [Bryobacteraceae bacterium]|nr:PQQ-binding-like beta-propeller repeat protein [Bryobacteraceae bacterium]